MGLENLDENRFAEVGSRLIEKYGVFPIVFGGQEDRDKGERLLRIWQTARMRRATFPFARPRRRWKFVNFISETIPVLCIWQLRREHHA